MSSHCGQMLRDPLPHPQHLPRDALPLRLALARHPVFYFQRGLFMRNNSASPSLVLTHLVHPPPYVTTCQ